ncbi:MAG: hypothetical protein D6678_06985 [Zetaproteobacteria bacterium]|nr:MAG: hypothetical protein D6678_06985 [Zetaproteobacteria bacterium]
MKGIRLLCLLLPVALGGCLAGTATSTAVGVAADIVTVPFKVGGALIDAVGGDEDEQEATDE